MSENSPNHEVQTQNPSREQVVDYINLRLDQPYEGPDSLFASKQKEYAYLKAEMEKISDEYDLEKSKPVAEQSITNILDFKSYTGAFLDRIYELENNVPDQETVDWLKEGAPDPFVTEEQKISALLKIQKKISEDSKNISMGSGAPLGSNLEDSLIHKISKLLEELDPAHDAINLGDSEH